MKYPTLKRILTSELDRYLSGLPPEPTGKSTRGRKPTNRVTWIAKVGMKVGVGTLSNWLSGETYPGTERNIQKIVDFFYPAGGPEAARLKSQIERVPAADHIISLDEEIRIAPLNYPPFSGSDRLPELRKSDGEVSGTKGDIDKIVSRLFDLSQIKHRWVERRTGNDAMQLLRSGETNVNLCLFDAPARCTDFHAFDSPARISINMVTLVPKEISGDASKTRRKQLQELLAPGIAVSAGGRSLDVDGCIACVVPSEVGDLYLRSTVGFRSVREVPTLEPIKLAEALVKANQDAVLKGKIAFLCVDELTTLRTLAALVTNFKDKVSEKYTPELVFPLATETSSQAQPKQHLPAFVIGLATVSRQQTDLREFLGRALRLLLLTEIETVSYYYHNLYESLQTAVEGLLDSIRAANASCHQAIMGLQKEPVSNASFWNRGCAIQFALYSLRLNPAESRDVFEQLNLPWGHVVDRVHALLKPITEGAEPVRAGKFRLGYRPTAPVCVEPVDAEYLFGENATRQSIRHLARLGFLGSILSPLQHLADPYWVRKLAAAEKNPAEDIWLGFFETFDRARDWRFYRVPFFLPLNAVVLSEDLAVAGGGQDKLQKLLKDPAGSPRGIVEAARFVVLPGGSGHETLLRRSGVDARKIIPVSQLDKQAYVEALAPGRPQDGEIRIAVVDLIHCLEILEFLRDNAPEHPGVLLFPPLNNDLPEFNVGIAVKRTARPWVEFFDDVFFDRYLREEWARLSELMVNLHDDTASVLDRLLVPTDYGVNAVDLARHFLCLTRQDEVEELGLSKNWGRVIAAADKKLRSRQNP